MTHPSAKPYDRWRQDSRHQMKRSGQVGLVLLTALGLASCGRSSKPQPAAVVNPPSEAAGTSQATMAWDNKPRDPCAQQYFDENLCRSAVDHRGYHYGGTWIPMIYSRPYDSYYSAHRTFLSSGGSYSPTPVEVYHPGFKAPASGEIVRGGFGTTAAAIHSGSSSGSHTSASPSSHSASSSSSGHSSSSSGSAAS